MSAITDIMTCKRILVQSHERTSPQFTAVLYAVVSKFNVDGLIPLIFNKCNLCGMYVENVHLMCINPECSMNLNMEVGSDELESILNIRLSLTDCTGTLENCILHHQAATKILSEINNFQNMNMDQKTELKWKYLFTNCKIKLVVTKTYQEEKPTILVVDIVNKGPILQFISCIPIY
ncbi:protein hold'em-like isoform X1 [Sipha flava]|uniref:Protein hold'em-like isoform X1 n=1 Tax=Sipha flava TaxID=143950 RepID=A0A8B8GQ63_9HEMI|nr:protein hold'em-like isoform X1 [Sipha flava]